MEFKARLIVPAMAPVLFATSIETWADPKCLAPGERIHWIADYCMSKMQTDDEIAVSDCIEGERRRKLPAGCAGNLHFKREMCRSMIAAGTRKGTVEKCVQDASFMGRTVQNKGVGG